MDDVFEFEVIRQKDDTASGPQDDVQYLEDIKLMVSDVLCVNFRNHKVIVEHLPTKFLYASDAYVVLVKVSGFLVSIHKSRFLDLIEKFGDVAKNKFNAWLLIRPSSYRFSEVFDFKLQSGHSWPLQALSFGCVVDMNEFVAHWEPEISESQSLQTLHVTFYHDKRCLRIYMHQRVAVHHFLVDYSSVQSVLLSQENNQWTLYLNVKHPPLLYEIKNNEKSDLQAKEEDDADKVSEQKHIILQRVIRCPQLQTTALIARCTTIKLTFKRTTRHDDKATFWSAIWKSVRNMQRLAENPINIYFCGINQATKSPVGSTCADLWSVVLPFQLATLPFDVLFAFHCVFMINFKLVDELNHNRNFPQFIELVKVYTKLDARATELALYDLFHAIDSAEPINSLKSLGKLFARRFREKKTSTIFDDEEKQNFAEVKRCVMTPSHIIFHPPITCLKSRFLRNYDPSFALRLYLRDENMNEVTHTVRGEDAHINAFLREYLVNGLINGISLFDRKYEYLGSSTSQLRDGGMYLYAKDMNGKVASTIRDEIGELKVIKNPPKYVARVGQAFSQPLGVVPRIPRSFVSEIPDVKVTGHEDSEKASILFSDGVGTISTSLAKVLALAMGKENSIPSAYQIRYAGCKGMLTLDPRLEGDQICVRKSMIKFQSDSESMEILKISEPRYACLNQPFVNLLNQQGISTNVFLRMQLRCINQIAKAFRCNCRAVKLLHRICGKLKLPLYALAYSGVDLLAEPFFRGILDVSSKSMIASLKHKARIPLDHNKARNLLGVMDETGSLEEDEIFIQYTVDRPDKTEEKQKVLTGDVLVTKFPCIHPGDVRKVKTVDIPALHHLVDVIVFPSKGPRPLSNQMAGSDLDGDEYLAVWDKDLIPPGASYGAMVYPDVEASTLTEEVTVESILSFLCDFVKDSGVGQISNSHLALSDQAKNGIFSKPALSLAAKCAVALDYAKTGDKVTIEMKERPHRYPDFMDKMHEKPTYQSIRALGRLYRQVLVFEQTLDTATNIEEQGSRGNQVLVIDGWREFEEDAKEAYAMYKGLIGTIQRQFGIDDELALLSDSYSKNLKYICGREDNVDTRELISRFVGIVFRRMKERFDSDFKGMSQFDKNRSPRYHAKASAWYCVTRDLNAKNQIDPYYGLPWTIGSHLAQMVAHLNPDLGNANCQHKISLSSPKYFKDSQSSANVRTVIMKWWNVILEDGHLGASAEDPQDVEWKCLQTLNQCFNDVILKTLGKPLGFQVASVFKEIIAKVKIQLTMSDIISESLNMLAISATMALYRLYRTRDLDSVTQSASNDKKLSVMVICLSQNKKNLRKWMSSQWNQGQFLKALRSVLPKDSGSEVVVKHHDGSNPNASFSLVTAIADQKTLFKLRNAMMKDTFHADVQKLGFTIV